MANRDLSLSSRIEGLRPANSTTVIHFPLDEIKTHFDENISSIIDQFTVSDILSSENRIEEAKTVLRSQIVLLEGVLDFYIHELSKFALFQMFIGSWDQTEKYKTLQVPMKDVSVGLTSHDSDEWFFEFLNRRFCNDVFLSADSMNDQLNLIGVPFNTVMHTAFAKPDEQKSRKYGRTIVSELFNRRNQIAHQMDRDHATAVQADIDKQYVQDCISNVTKMVNAMHSIALSKSVN